MLTKEYLRWPGAMSQVTASELKPCSLWMIREKGGMSVTIYHG